MDSRWHLLLSLPIFFLANIRNYGIICHLKNTVRTEHLSKSLLQWYLLLQTSGCRFCADEEDGGAEVVLKKEEWLVKEEARKGRSFGFLGG